MRHFATKTFGVLVSAFAIAAAAASVVAPGTALGGQSACSTSQAFAQFGDQDAYTLLINGSLESGLTGFQYTGAPAIAGVNEKYQLNGAKDKQSIQLATGDSATFHAGCLPTLNPSMRFVARAVGSTSGSLTAQVQYQTPDNVLHTVTLATLSAAAYSDWTPTQQLPFLNTNQSLTSQTKGQVRLILTPNGSARWQVDDLYIDPHHSK